MQIIDGAGGESVNEARFNSEPDIIFDFIERSWLLSVKIGETPVILRSAFIQYQTHKEESGRTHGLILFLPERARHVAANPTALAGAVETLRATCLVDTPYVKEEWRDATFPEIVARILLLLPRLRQEERTAYPLTLVISLLQQHVEELMRDIGLAMVFDEFANSRRTPT
jgi:hypothetical protein